MFTKAWKETPYIAVRVLLAETVGSYADCGDQAKAGAERETKSEEGRKESAE